MSFAIYADNRFRVALAQVYPLFGEVNLHTVDVVDFLVLVDFLHLGQNGIYVSIGRQVHTVFGHKVGWISGTQFTHLLAFVCQVAQEEGDTYQCIASVVAGGIDDAAVAFATDNGTHFLHLCGDVHFAHSRCKVFLSVLTGYVAQGAGRAQVRHGAARCMLQNIICYTDQCIFFAVHASVFADDGQTINVGVNYKSYIILAGLHQVHDVAQVLFQRFGVVLEVAGRFTVELLYMLYA